MATNRDGVKYSPAVKEARSLARRLTGLAEHIYEKGLRLPDGAYGSSEKLGVIVGVQAIINLLAKTRSTDLSGTIQAFNEVRERFHQLQVNPLYLEHLATVPLRAAAAPWENIGEAVNAESHNLQVYVLRHQEVGHFIQQALNLDIGEATFQGPAMGSVTPAQGIAPYRFAIVDQVIQIEDQPAVSPTERREIVDAAHEALTASAKRVEVYLLESNFDKRMLIEVQLMQGLLEDRKNIIALGLASLEFSGAVGSMDEQLPGMWHGKLSGFAEGVIRYVGQFPEWADFNEASSLSELTAKQVFEIHQAGREVVQEIKNHKDVASPKVAQAVGHLTDSIKVPSKADKRSAFATMQTLANLANVLARALSKVGGAVGKGALKGVEGGAEVVVKTSMMVVSAQIIMMIAPVSGSAFTAAWLAEAATSLKKKAAGSDDEAEFDEDIDAEKHMMGDD